MANSQIHLTTIFVALKFLYSNVGEKATSKLWILSMCTILGHKV